MKLLIGLILGICLIGCYPYQAFDAEGNPIQRVDECNFHIGQYGVGLRWKSLPAPIVLNSESMDQDSIDATLKVVDEWNDIWRQETGGELFDILGAAQYPDIKDVFRDKYNSVSVLDSRSNREALRRASELNPRILKNVKNEFLPVTTQGITQISGAWRLGEADIFINDDHFDFYYENYNIQASKEEDFSRNLASTVPVSFFEWFKSILFFWKKQPEREIASRKRIPSDLIDFESVMAHEMGHLLGLGHTTVSGSIMARKLRAGTTRRGLNQIDLNSLKCGYLK